MAKIIYEVYQNQNEHNAAFGKWYGRVKYLESLNTRKLSNHIAEHGSIYTPDVVYGVMEKFRSCLLEMLLNSKKVKIDGLGTFYTTIECQKGGALTKDKFSVNKDIKGLHIRFLPEQEQEQNISLLKKEDEESLTPDPSPNGEGSDNQGGGNGGNSGSGSQNQTLTSPTISGNTSFTESTQVSISGPDGAEIHYTTDGTVPTAESTLYSEAFTLSATTTVKAIAIKDGQSSEVVSRVFTKSSNDDGMGQD